MGESNKDEGEEGSDNFQKSVRIHVGAINYKSHSSCTKIGGAIYGEEGLTHGIYPPRKGLRQNPKGGSLELFIGCTCGIVTQV